VQVACLSNLPIRIIGEVESGQMTYFWEMIFCLNIISAKKSLCILIFIPNPVRRSKLPFHLIISSSFLFHITPFILFSSFHGSGQDTSSIKSGKQSVWRQRVGRIMPYSQSWA